MNTWNNDPNEICIQMIYLAMMHDYTDDTYILPWKKVLKIIKYLNKMKKTLDMNT